jgi:hypothetical protein
LGVPWLKDSLLLLGIQAHIINENNIADIVEDALQKALPRDFNIETDDGESVLVKLNLIEGSSSLVLLSNDVKSLKIRIRKE